MSSALLAQQFLANPSQGVSVSVNCAFQSSCLIFFLRTYVALIPAPTCAGFDSPDRNVAFPVELLFCAFWLKCCKDSDTKFFNPVSRRIGNLCTEKNFACILYLDMWILMEPSIRHKVLWDIRYEHVLLEPNALHSLTKLDEGGLPHLADHAWCKPLVPL